MIQASQITKKNRHQEKPFHTQSCIHAYQRFPADTVVKGGLKKGRRLQTGEGTCGRTAQFPVKLVSQLGEKNAE